MRSYSYVAALIGLLLASGCDLFGGEDDGTIVVHDHVIVNDEPYDPCYTVFVESARPGERSDLGVIELDENGSL